LTDVDFRQYLDDMDGVEEKLYVTATYDYHY